jgi:ketosteroid isomerase-like protein
MPSANLDMVLSIFANWERGDFSSVSWADPNMEFVGIDGPEPGSWKGLVNIAAGWAGFLGTWVEYHPEADEYLELDRARVVVLIRGYGLGKTSGLKVAHEGAVAFCFRDGKVTSLTIYWERARARAELGLAVESS